MESGGCECATMKNDPNLVVTVSNRNNDGVWKVFITNWQDGFIFGLRQFAKRRRARTCAESMAMRWSCAIEFK